MSNSNIVYSEGGASEAGFVSYSGVRSLAFLTKDVVENRHGHSIQGIFFFKSGADQGN